MGVKQGWGWEISHFLDFNLKSRKWLIFPTPLSVAIFIRLAVVASLAVIDTAREATTAKRMKIATEL